MRRSGVAESSLEGQRRWPREDQSRGFCRGLAGDSLSPSCHLAQNEGSGLRRARLAQKSRTGEGFIHPPTSSIQLTDLGQVDAAAVLVFSKREIGTLQQLRKQVSIAAIRLNVPLRNRPFSLYI